MNEQPTHLDLFSGIGGFALAAGWAGFKTIGFCEIDPYCQAVLKKHWPQTPIHSDIRELRGGAYGNCTLLTGGFPCQPFSHTGKRRGKDDDRHLWPEMLRVIEEAKPTWIIGENVAGIINMELDKVCSDLEAKGYEVQPLVIPACGVDAPHRRDRVWIMAHAKGGKRGGIQNKIGTKGPQDCDKLSGITSGLSGKLQSKNVAESISTRQGRDKRIGETGTEGVSGGYASECSSYCRESNVADSLWIRGSAGIPEPKQWKEGEPKITYNNSCRESEKAEWLSEPNVGRLADGIPNRVAKLRGLGNAIVPQVAYQIIKGIRELL